MRLALPVVEPAVLRGLAMASFTDLDGHALLSQVTSLFQLLTSMTSFLDPLRSRRTLLSFLERS